MNAAGTGGRALVTAAAGLGIVTCCIAQPAASPAEEAAMATTLVGDKGDDWSKYLVDTAPGSISAFSLLGVPGEAVATVENVRDVALAVKGLGSNNTGIGFSVTPARTSFLGMDLTSYYNSNFDRLLGALTFGYAQGPASIEDRNYERKAISVETNYFLRKADDPFVAVWEAYNKGECESPLSRQKPDTPPAGFPPADAEEEPARKPGEASEEITAAAVARAEECRKRIVDNLRWNRSQISASFATGWIRPESGATSQERLGQSLAVGLVYGFDGSPTLSRNSAAYLTLRRTKDEPVLETLASGSVQKRSTSLAVLRLVGGSKSVRGLVEASNADSSGVTPTQRSYKRAVGFDYRLAEGVWLNFRVGKQRKLDGSGDETTSLFNLSYSPSPLLR
jgi:hypothetical protein